MKTRAIRSAWRFGHVSPPLPFKAQPLAETSIVKAYTSRFNIPLSTRYNMVLEDQRFIHEDLERLEQAIADRVAEDPRNVSLYVHPASVADTNGYFRSEIVFPVTMRLPIS